MGWWAAVVEWMRNLFRKPKRPLVIRASKGSLVVTPGVAVVSRSLLLELAGSAELFAGDDAHRAGRGG